MMNKRSNSENQEQSPNNSLLKPFAVESVQVIKVNADLKPKPEERPKTIRYAAHSKKGFSKANPAKPNQDSFLIC